jgi:hypothetical protein
MEFALIHLTHYADQIQQFLQCSITGEETWVNHAMSETKKASIISPSKEIQSNAIHKKNIMQLSFRTIKVCFLWISLPW